MTKMTPWFQPRSKPARVGVYETEWRGIGRFFNFWDGRDWHWGWRTLERAERSSDPMTRRDQRDLCKWRGLAANPIPLPSTTP